MDFTGLPDDNNENGLDITGLPDTNAAKLSQQYRATTASPDDAAKVFDITKRTGLPKPVVERNRPHAEKLAVEPDWDSIEAAAPVTARELAANAKLFELAHDDTDNLTQIEKAMRGNGQPVLKASRGPETSFSSVLKGQANVVPFALDRMRQGIRLELADLFGFDTVKQDALRKLDQTNFRESLVTPEIQNTAGRWIYGGAANIQRVLPSVAAGIATRSPAVGLAGMGIQVQPETYGKYRARGGTPTEAAIGSGIETGIEVGTEMLPMGFLVDKFGKAGAKEFIAGYLGRELPTELAAEISQGAVDTAIANPDKTWSQWASELPDTVGQTVVSTLMMSGGLTAGHEVVRRMAPEQDKANAATQDAAALQNIAQLAAASKLRARDPQTFAEFTAAVTEDGAVQDIYLDPRALQQSGVDLEALAQVSPSVAAQYSEALATGGDIIIPVQEYASSIAGSQIDAVLTPHLRSASDALSLNEAQQFYQTQAEEFQKAATQVMEERAQDTAWQQSAKAVETKLVEQLQGAGRFTPDVNNAYATLMRDFYVTTASRMGMTPEEMYARYPLQVRADRAKGAAVMDQGNVQAGPEGFRVVRTGDVVDGRIVRDEVPNLSSIGASLENYTVLDGVREVPLTAFDKTYIDSIKMEKLDKRTRDLAEQIKASGEINPLIVAVDSKGAYIIEGGHRYDALVASGATSLPAVVVIDESDPPVQPTQQQQPEAPSFLAQALKTVTDALGITQQEQAETIDVDGVARPVQNSNGQRIAQTEEGLRNFWRWFGDSKVVDDQGRPLVVYHGTFDDFSKFSDRKLGANTDNNASSDAYAQTSRVGFWFNVNPMAGPKAGYDTDMPVYLSIQNPERVYNLASLARGLESTKGRTYRKQLIEGGFDGVVLRDEEFGGDSYIAFSPTQIKSAVGNQGTFDPQDANILNQSGLDMGQFFQDKPDLVVQHNLSADNLLHALKMGGIPVPSLAITKADHPLSGFGEITLLGSKEMADPKGYASTKVFGGDIYSPRYPSVEFQFTPNMRKQGEARLKEGMAATESPYIEWSEVESRGPEELTRMSAFIWQFLKKEGVEPTIVRTEPTPLPFALQPFVDVQGDYFDLVKDPAFIDAAYKAQEDMYIAAGQTPQEAADRIAEMKQNGQERGVNFLVQGYARSVENYRRDTRQAGKIDKNATRRSLEAQVVEAGLSDKLITAAREFFTDIGPNERIFQGFTNGGNRRYVAHTLENVVAILKKELRGGEGFNYGVGTIRAKFTPQFKSIKQIQEAKNRLMDKAAFEKVKDEIDKEFFALVNDLAPFHSYGNNIGFADTLSSAMYDAATMGVPRALKENGFSTVPEEKQQDIAEFLAKLRTLPTEYFEAKILRDVDLAEFSAAVVPEGVAPEVVKALESRGVKDISYYKKGDEADRRAKIGEHERLFFQPIKGQENNRGEISFGADITKQPSVITLFKTADLSTFLHEMGHFQLEVLAHIASQPNAPAEIVSDMEKVLGWFGVADIPTWNAMSLEEKRPFHEQFARGFEAYLFEGKAPTPELASLFARFRSWLVNVYKSIKALRVDISDELRGVFDRMVATEDAIREAEALRAYAPLFTGPDQVGDPQLWNDLQSAGAEATQTALDALQKRSLRDMQWLNNARSRLLKQMQRDAKEKRSAVEAEVRAEVEDMPVYKAMRFLRTGELTAENGDKIKADIGYRLDTDALAEMYPETMLARPALEKLRGMTRKEGLHPDLVAQMFGYTSGDHLVRELVQAEPMAELIEGMTDQRTLERYGDLSSPDVIARAVDEAIHNDARAMFVATELKALTKATGPVRVITKAAKAYAEAMIARKKVRDIKPNQYTTAETRAAKAAQKALQAGDTAMAASEKRNQLVQNYSARAAYDALDEVEKVVRYLRKFDNEGTRKNLDVEYLDQIDALLERFDFRTITNKAADKRASLVAWVEAQRAQGFDPDIPDDVLSEAMRKPYRELTMEELRGVVDSVKQIEHLGRLKHKLLTAQDQREFEAARDDIVASIEANAKKTLPEQRSSDRGFLVKASSMFRTAMAIHRKFSSLARGFDGYKDGGPAWEYLVRNMNARGDFEAVENEKATMALTKLLVPVTDKANGKLTAKQYFPSIGKSFSREERISLLLNMGNEANLERLLTGERLAPAQLQEVVGTLTKADAEFANQVWEYLDSFWPQVAEKQRRLTGKTPEKVEAVPFTLTLATGETVQMRGGYYPIAYDPLRSERSSADLNAEVARQIQQGLYTQAQTRRGHTKARAESTGRPLRYDFGEVISNHVTQVIHDLAWHEYLIDANRLLRSQTIENAVRQHYGIETLKEMKDTLRDIAIGNMGMEKGAFAWNHLRYGTTISALAFNVFNTLQNITGITQSMSRIGTKWVFKGAAHWAGDIARLESSVAEIHEKSDFMRLRAKTLQREINEIRNKVSGNDSKLQASFFYLQSKTQLLVDVPTWWGAYEKAMSMDEMTEDKAVALADQAVIDAQGSGQVKDLAGIQRGGAGMKLFTSFYSFFNQTFNLTAEAYGRTNFKKPSEVALFTADMVLLYTLPALLSTLLKAAMEDDWDDEDKLAKKVIGDQISFMMGTVVGLRELSAAGKEAAGVGDGFGYTGPASVRFFSDAYRLGQQISQGEADEPFWKALNNTAGVLFHYPAGQINRTATGIVTLSEGRTDNPLAVVMGAPKN